MSKNKYRKYRFRLPSKLSMNTPTKAMFNKGLVIVSLLAAFSLFLFGNRGMIHLVEMKIEKYKLQKEIDRCMEENRALAKEIETLRTDLKAVERIAREELGLVKKGEVVYKFVTSGRNEPDK